MYTYGGEKMSRAINVSDETYARLKQSKGEMSFSQYIAKLIDAEHNEMSLSKMEKAIETIRQRIEKIENFLVSNSSGFYV